MSGWHFDPQMGCKVNRLVIVSKNQPKWDMERPVLIVPKHNNASKNAASDDPAPTYWVQCTYCGTSGRRSFGAPHEVGTKVFSRIPLDHCTETCKTLRRCDPDQCKFLIL